MPLDQGGADGSVRLLLTKNPAVVSVTPCQVLGISFERLPVALVDGFVLCDKINKINSYLQLSPLPRLAPVRASTISAAVSMARDSRPGVTMIAPLPF